MTLKQPENDPTFDVLAYMRSLSPILSIIFGIQLYKETKKRRSERDSLEESE